MAPTYSIEVNGDEEYAQHFSERERVARRNALIVRLKDLTKGFREPVRAKRLISNNNTGHQYFLKTHFSTTNQFH